MSKLNAVMLSGFVFTVPKEIPVDKTGLYYMAVTFDITIERKRYINLLDKITVICYNDTAEKAMRLKKGDYIISDEVNLRTVNYKRTIEYICPQCHHVEEQEINSEKTEVILTDYAVIPRARPQSILGVNRAVLLGNICKPVEYFRFPSGRGQAQFKIAVDRIGAMKKLQHADYPFVLTYGNEAEYARENFEVGNLIVLDGCVSQREIVQKFAYSCPECGVGYYQEENMKVVEVIAYRINQMKYAETRTIEEIEEREKEDTSNIIEYNDETTFQPRPVPEVTEEEEEEEIIPTEKFIDVNAVREAIENRKEEDDMLESDDDISDFLNSLMD